VSCTVHFWCIHPLMPRMHTVDWCQHSLMLFVDLCSCWCCLVLSRLMTIQ
jgi:hypothetical protein